MSVFSPQHEQNLATQLLSVLKKTPSHLNSHQSLARLYHREGHLQSYEKQLKEAETWARPFFLSDVVQNNEVLGLTDLRREIAHATELQKERLMYWEEVAKQHPLYREAWVQLAYQAFQVGDIKKAEEYWAKAMILDPNYHSTLSSLF